MKDDSFKVLQDYLADVIQRQQVAFLHEAIKIHFGAEWLEPEKYKELNKKHKLHFKTLPGNEMRSYFFQEQKDRVILYGWIGFLINSSGLTLETCHRDVGLQLKDVFGKK